MARFLKATVAALVGHALPMFVSGSALNHLKADPSLEIETPYRLILAEIEAPSLEIETL